MRKVSIDDVGGKIVKENDTYTVKDNTHLNNLVLSSTALKSGKNTSGHSHEGQEEVYYFTEGMGIMKIDDTQFPVSAGDIILIDDGEYHQVFNNSDSTLRFVCVFDGNRNH